MLKNSFANDSIASVHCFPKSSHGSLLYGQVTNCFVGTISSGFGSGFSGVGGTIGALN